MDRLQNISRELLPGGLELFDIKIQRHGKEMGVVADDGPDQPRYRQLAIPNSRQNNVSGGMGEVTKMFDVRLARPVAAKRSFFDSYQIIDEAKILAEFNHPNLLIVHNVAVRPDGKSKQEMYFIAEWVEGNSLDQWLEKPRKVQDIAGVADQIADGVSYVHSKGKIYGDLKPRNTIVNSFGQVKLVDFGISVNKGKPVTAYVVYFSSPEQEDSGRVTEASDVFSFGRVLRTMIDETGLKTKLGGIEKDFDLWVDRATKPEPTERFATINEANTKLQKILNSGR